MGAKTCKCNIGDDDEAQLKLSRDPEGTGKYDFPGSQDLGVSALAGSSQSSSYVPPLAPTINGERGDHADVAAGMPLSSMTSGKLPAVLEETGEDLESLSRQHVESENGSRAAQTEQLADLKEALLECVDEKGQLVPAPGEHRLSRSGAITADGALGTEDQQKERGRSASLDNGDGQIIGMTLPVAADLALRDEPLPDKKDPRQSAPGNAAGLTDSTDLPDNAQLTCWQVAEKNGSCVCPFGSGSLELRRDAPSEHYDLHGTAGLANPEHVSALAIPPAHENGEQQRSQPDSHRDASLHPDEGSPLPRSPSALANSASANGDLRATAQDSGDPGAIGDPTDIAKAGGQQDTRLETLEDGLDGEWINEGQVNILKGSLIMFASGETCGVEPTSKTTCHMVLEGTVYYGRLSPDRKKLLWSDGDIWMRKEVPKPIQEPAPTGIDDDPSKVPMEAKTSRASKPDAIGGEGDKKQASTASKQQGKSKDQKNTEAAADGEKKKACCIIA
jgi:hypothetical protein|mmetsp:Transcript_51503/g.81687  ORF Transcript_51503/g.81687 Transcript_51503/m.81687 type:complete len:504 (+) Transcript_51503:62-1573(+)